MHRGPDNLVDALTAIFRRNGKSRGRPAVIYREPSLYSTTFPCEIVTCRFAAGRDLRLFCKYAPRDARCSYGQRGGVGYEAEVYRWILHPSGCSAPAFYGRYRDPGTGAVWLVLEYLNRSLPVGKVPGLRAMRLAARWIGEFHARNAAHMPRARRRFLTAYDAAYYRGWLRRSARLARLQGLHMPWFPALARRLETEIGALAEMPQTIIHGEYYPHNVLFQAGAVRPVDWETAAVAPGEIDLATLGDGWPNEVCRLLEAEYQVARWPAGAPADYRRNLDLARIYLQLRWLGDARLGSVVEMRRWKRLYAASRRLELI